MIFASGNHLLRISLHSSANFGSAGMASINDRPVALDPWSHLPPLPDSSLKGVIAGLAYGNPSNSKNENTARNQVFGRADKTGAQFTQGDSAALTFGDGELLCFPLAGRSGKPCMVFPARTLHRLANLPLEHSFVWHLSHDLPPDQCCGDVAAEHLPPAISVTLYNQTTGGSLRTLAGLGKDIEILIAGDDIAATLWNDAVETRDLTRVDKDTNRVAPGSLRKIELIPEGTVFVSLTTNSKSKAIQLELPEHIQLGSWEGNGHGFVSLDWIDSIGAIETEFEEIRADNQQCNNAAVMTKAYTQIEACKSKPYAGKVRTLLREFGTRWRLIGPTHALTFIFSKAKCNVSFESESHANEDVLANRFVLNVLLNRSTKNLHSAQDALSIQILEIIRGDTPAPPHIEKHLEWLSRNAETMLMELEGG